ncbi:recombinase family protein [Vibrio parahaemolyticus]
MQRIIYPYVRFSSEKQSAGHSHERQIEKINEYASVNGYEVNDTLNLRDLGVSAFKGKNAEKGALAAFLKMIEDGTIPTDGTSYLCIEQFDRLSRQTVDESYALFRKILISNVNIITLMDDKVYTKKSLNEMVSIISSLLLMEQANVESEKKSERVSAVFKSKLEKLRNGEKIQFAYMLPGWIDNIGTKENPNFIINDQVKTVRMIIDMYLGGETMGHIARILNEKQIPQFARKKTKNAISSWNSGKISHLLVNRCLIGELKITKTKEIIKDYYPSVISKDEWDIIQSTKRTNATTKIAGRRSINIFQGRLFCADCGNKYYFETDDKTGKHGKKYIYHMLKCSGRRFHSCDSKSIKYDDLTGNNLFFFEKVLDQKTEDYYNKIKLEISQFENQIEELKKEQNELDLLLNNKSINFTAHAIANSKILDQIDILEKDIALNKQHIAFTMNTNMVDKFDKNDPVSVAKAKKFIKDNYAGILISSKYGTIISLMKSGQFIINPIPNRFDDSIPKASLQLFEIKEQIQSQDKKGLLDGKLKELLDAFNFLDRFE